ncbi:MAG TPA: magnesium transporter [Acidimicrobiales bacterium]|nr:magnesium transporter [Acidimicrobiales bacterium]
MASRRLLPGADARQGLVALALNSSTSLVAGGVLGSLTHTFERYPGLLLLVPAAIGLRGNVFGSLGNRVSTSIHAGELQLRLRGSTVLGQNVMAAGALTLGMSVVLVAVAALVSTGLGLGPTIGLADLALVSVGGGTLASLPVLLATLGLAAGAVRFGWDLDNVTAPLVSTLGDVLTLPALWLATGLLGFGLVTSGLGWVLAAVGLGALAWGIVAQLPQLRRIVRTSLPILAVAGIVSSLAGVALERRLDTFSALPALLILVPAHLSSAGALGGILSGRLSSKLLLGLAPPTAVPSRAARDDLGFVAALSLPVFVANGIGAHVVAELLGEASPGLVKLVLASVLGGAAAMAVVLAIAYYGTIATIRTDLDPDTYGIPMVSSTVDLVGALTLIVAITAMGLT